MMLRRRRVLGTAMAVGATTAMISGTRRNMAQRRAYDAQADAMETANQQQQAAPVQQAAPISATSQVTQQIQELNDMRVAGLITPEEYDAKKKQLLNI